MPLALSFPVVFHAGPLSIPAHLVFESLGYFLGFRLYLTLRRRSGDLVPDDRRWTIIAAAAVGGALGSKLLVWLQHAPELLAQPARLEGWLGGKTIVGGLLGGTIAVEWSKRAIGETRRTGDLFVLPLCLGTAIGRVGCFLAGLDDHTCGGPTSLPWGVDFGDGVRRHPAQLYEIVALAVIGAWAVAWRCSHRYREGDLFRGFVFGYAAFRLGLDFLKPDDPRIFGLSAIQIACLAALAYYARDVVTMIRRLAAG